MQMKEKLFTTIDYVVPSTFLIYMMSIATIVDVTMKSWHKKNNFGNQIIGNVPTA